MTEMLSSMTIRDLRGILIDCAGGDADALPDDIVDVPFDELGYDSLALIETSATLKRSYGVVIADEQLLEVQTPGQLLALVNAV